MAFSSSSLRVVAFLLVCFIPAILTAQTATPPASEVNPQLMSELRESLKQSSEITLVEVDGTHLRGTVTELAPDHVSVTIKFGTPSVYVPYAQIAKIDHPVLTHRGKIVLTILVVVSVVAIVVLALKATKGAINDSHLP